MMTVHSRHLLVVSLLAALPMLGACDKIAQKATEAAIEHATGAKVDKDGNAVTIKTDKGEMKVSTAEEGGSIALPADFPSDVFLPSERKVGSVLNVGNALMVNLTTSDSMNAVFAATQKAMADGGWKQEMAMQSTDGSSLAYTKDKRQVNYHISTEEGTGTTLMVQTGATE